jgi:hypothetical protein
VLLDFTPESHARFTESAVRDALRAAGAFTVAAVKKTIEQPARARLGTNPEGLDHLQLLEHYLLSREVPPARREELLDTVRDLLGDGD